MPGTWVIGDTTAVDQRPGAYANFTSIATTAIRGGLSGTVAATVRADWGPGATVQKISNIGELTNYYTASEAAFPETNAYFVVKNILQGGAKDVLVYRLLGPDARKGTRVFNVGSSTAAMTISGKYEGARSNAFTLTITTSATDSDRKTLTLTESGTTLKVWHTRLDNAAGVVQDTVNMINNDDANFWITATFTAEGDGTFANVASTIAQVTGVDDEDGVVAADYVEATDAFENEDFSTVYFDQAPGAILTTCGAWVNTVRAAGKKIIMVTGSDSGDAVSAAKTDAEAFNNEGIVYVHPGYTANNEAAALTTYHGYLAAARVAGIIAGQTFRETPTFQRIQGITDLVVRLGSTNVKSLLSSGVVPLVYDGRNFKIERGITTLSTPSSIQSTDNQKIKIVRILDNINNAVVNAISDTVIGKVSNDRSGRSSVISLISNFLYTLYRDGAIEENFSVQEDPDNPPVDDRFYIKIGLSPIDAIEFVYLTVEVS